MSPKVPVSTVAASVAEQGKAGDGEQPTGTRSPPALAAAAAPKAPWLWGGQRPLPQAYLLRNEGAQRGSRPGGHPSVFPSAPTQAHRTSTATCGRAHATPLARAQAPASERRGQSRGVGQRQENGAAEEESAEQQPQRTG